MEPNFHNGEYLIVNELGYKETNISFNGKSVITIKPYKELHRGDVIVFRFPLNPQEFFIKRVIGLPNEKVEIKDGRIMIFNQRQPGGAILDESQYLPNSNFYTSCNGQCIFNLESDEYLVLGDNRSHSSDSRVWGTLPERFVIGKVLLKAWPFKKFEVFE
jgi:signal peptidase I